MSEITGEWLLSSARSMIRALGLVACLLAPPAQSAELEFRGRYVWSGQGSDFGGLSALWIANGGARMIALSDRGSFIEADVIREDGAVTDIRETRSGTLGTRPVKVVRRSLRDAEGIAVAPDGAIYVSYEGTTRVWRFTDLASPPDWAHPVDHFYGLQNNSGLEALAVDADGTLYTIPERSGAWERPFPVFRRKGDIWDAALSIPRSKTFLVVGADFGPDGMLYVLERDASRLTGFKTRVRRFRLDPDGFDAGETIHETRGGSLDNTEGISLWTDQNGQVVVSLITDNNFRSYLPTALIEFNLVE